MATHCGGVSYFNIYLDIFSLLYKFYFFIVVIILFLEFTDIYFSDGVL